MLPTMNNNDNNNKNGGRGHYGTHGKMTNGNSTYLIERQTSDESAKDETENENLKLLKTRTGNQSALIPIRPFGAILLLRLH